MTYSRAKPSIWELNCFAKIAQLSKSKIPKYKSKQNKNNPKSLEPRWKNTNVLS